MSPIAYLTAWRMKLAVDALKSTQRSVAEVALEVGYNSEAAFNRAFKRTFRMPPAQFRQHGKSKPAPIAKPRRGRSASA